jgi:hypothetical protein
MASETARAILTSPRPLTIVAALGRRAIALNIGGNKRFVTQCAIIFHFGDGEARVVPADFEFDGPSIPRAFWWIAGLSPADTDTLLAACIHDYGCANPDKIPRDLADAMFRVALGPARIFTTDDCEDGEELPGVEPWRRNTMYVGVRYWSHKSGAVQ